MSFDQLADDGDVIISGWKDTIEMIAEDRNGGRFEITVDAVDWRKIVPILLPDRQELAKELLTFCETSREYLPFQLDDDMKSFFWFSSIVECIGTSTEIPTMARCWARLPLRSRVEWWDDASCPLPVHAQILGRMQTWHSVFERKVPDWMPRLVDITNEPIPGHRREPGYWASAVTPIGRSCIYYVEDEICRLEGALALSDCPIRYRPAKDRAGTLALSAIDGLIAGYQALLRQPDLATKVGWDVTGHEFLEMEYTLNMWRARLAPPTKPSLSM